MQSDYRLDSDIVKQISVVPHFQNSVYKSLDIAATIDFFRRRYVQPLADLFDLSTSVVTDCGCGYGWFTFAYLLEGGGEAIAVDLDKERLEAAKQIASILSLTHKIRFVNSSIEGVPLGPDETDLFVSIETLEHVGEQNITRSLNRIREVTSRGVLITTPNRLFPVIAHDTRLPFIHWLPSNRRTFFAKMFGRQNKEHGNDFLSPWDLDILQDKFRVASSCLTFHSYRDYIGHFPHYSPYGGDGTNRFHYQPSRGKSLYYKTVTMLLGTKSYWLMPSLASLFTRK